MKALKLSAVLIVLSAFLFSATAVEAQEYAFDQSNSTLKVEGTSNLHEWEENVTQFSGTCSIDDLSSPTDAISNITLKAETKSLKSGKSIMDNKSYDALQADDYPYITFKSTSVKLYKTKNADQKEFIYIVYGDMTLAGKTKNIYFPVQTKVNADGNLEVTGSKKVYMSWFGIDPPTAMFGSLVVGDEVNVKFDVTLSGSARASN